MRSLMRQQKGRANTIPFSPSERNQVPEILAGVTSDLERAWRERQDRQHKEQFNEGALDAIKADPIGSRLITPEVMDIFNNSNPDKRAGLVNTLGGALQQARDRELQGARLANALKLTSMNIGADAPLKTAQTRNVNAEATQREQPAPANAGQPIVVNGKSIGEFGPNGEPHFYPQQAFETEDGQIPVDPIIDPASGRVVPGKGINRKTGAEIDTRDNPKVVTLDPTGGFYLDNKTKNWRPVPAGTALVTQASNSPAAPDSQPGFLKSIVNGLFGTSPAQPPAAPAAATNQSQAGAAAQRLQADAQAAISAGAPAAAVNQRLADKLKDLGATTP